MRSAALLAAILLAGCASTSSSRHLEPALPAAGGECTVQVVLSDGAPVAFVPLLVECGASKAPAITDVRGRFALPRGARCTVSSRSAALRARLRCDDPRALARLALPPVYRVELRWRLANGLALGKIELDETLPQPAAIPGFQLRAPRAPSPRRRRGARSCRPGASTARASTRARSASSSRRCARGPGSPRRGATVRG
jgi:hypothetical protein